MKRVFTSTEESFGGSPRRVGHAGELGQGGSRGPKRSVAWLRLVDGSSAVQQGGTAEARSAHPAGTALAGTLIGLPGGRRIDLQAELGRRACGERVANPTPLSTTHSNPRRNQT